jgi:D-methionine transport system permease protein
MGGDIMTDVFSLLYKPLIETLYMTFISSFFALLLGFPLGILLVITAEDGISKKAKFYSILSLIVNILRSFPFIILMILVFPLSRIIIGTTIGTSAAIVPLSIAATPFVARIIESALREVDSGLVEAAQAMGSSTWQIITKVLLKEALPGLILGITLSIISLIGYSAMAGAIGAGGLGDLAIRYGYQRFKTDVMIVSVIALIIIVQLTQLVGGKAAAYIVKKRSRT